jgi:hypothetical protein
MTHFAQIVWLRQVVFWENIPQSSQVARKMAGGFTFSARVAACER